MAHSFFTTFDETKSWLDRQKIQNYTINQDLTVNVHDDVGIIIDEYIPVQFRQVTGNFIILQSQHIKSLKGVPLESCRDFGCRNQYISRVDYLPQKILGNVDLRFNSIYEIPAFAHCVIEGSIDLSENNISSLKGIQKKVKTDFNVGGNALSTLLGGPEEVAGTYFCSNCALPNLEGVAQSMKGLNASNNRVNTLNHLKNVHITESLILHNNHLTRLEGLPLMITYLMISDNPIEEYSTLFSLNQLEKIHMPDLLKKNRNLMKLDGDKLTHYFEKLHAQYEKHILDNEIKNPTPIQNKIKI